MPLIGVTKPAYSGLTTLLLRSCSAGAKVRNDMLPILERTYDVLERCHKNVDYRCNREVLPLETR